MTTMATAENITETLTGLRRQLAETETYMRDTANNLKDETDNLVAEPKSQAAHYAVEELSFRLREAAVKVIQLRRQVAGAESVARAQGETEQAETWRIV